MGFSWARPTTFAEPMFTVGDNVHYYAGGPQPVVPVGLGDWEISEALLPLPADRAGRPRAWDADETIRRAIEIRDGRVVNPAILAFQHRSPEYPHDAA